MAEVDAPNLIRAVSFFDAQNLYRHAKEAFGYHHPNFDPNLLANAICKEKGWIQAGIRVYTGVPSPDREPMWAGYWAKRLLSMRRSGIATFSRPVRYRTEKYALPDGTMYEVDAAQEKGVDVRLAIDIMRLAYSKSFEVAIIFSQDQDLNEVAKEIKQMARDHSRIIKICSAFPSGSTASTNRGIDGSDWFRMNREFYDSCLDHYDYRPPSDGPKPPARPRIRLVEAGPY